MSRKYNFKCEVFHSHNELPEEISALMMTARAQLKRAYAPYSKFYVGAAVLLHNGEVYTGCNQENASFPLCICAERVALYNAGTNQDLLQIKALAITAHNPSKKLRDICMPCGACRQVIQEFEQRQNAAIQLYLSGEAEEVVKVDGIATLLPHSFSKDFLL